MHVCRRGSTAAIVILRIQGKSPDRILSVRGFLLPGLFFQGGYMVLQERIMTKILLFSLKDWDAFQQLMRSCLTLQGERKARI
jgi:hypothetical protein